MQLIAGCSSWQALLQERVQLPLSGVFRDRLLHFQGGLPVAEIEGGEVVIEPRLFVHQAPAQWRFFNAGKAGEGFPDELAEPCPARAKAAPLWEAQRVPKRRAHCLVEGTLGAIPEVEHHLRAHGKLRGVRYSEDDGDDGKASMIMESELNEDQYCLLRAFNDLAEGAPTTDVAASDAAQQAGFDPGSRQFNAALSYLVDIGHLMGAGGEKFTITVAGINEVQRRPQL